MNTDIFEIRVKPFPYNLQVHQQISNESIIKKSEPARYHRNEFGIVSEHLERIVFLITGMSYYPEQQTSRNIRKIFHNDPTSL